MTCRDTRTYANPIQAVVFDWAGTTIDYGSLAPVLAFCHLFETHGVPITLAEARVPMGIEKSEHIRQLLLMPRIRQAWIDEKGVEADESTIDQLYRAFIPIQTASIAQRSSLIPGTKTTFEFLLARHIKVGANTGYSQEMITQMRKLAAEQGYTPASVVCATDVPKGRPYPHMLLKNMLELDVSAVQAVVKVDDTLSGIAEGLNAGCWTVGIAVTGNEIGLDLPDWQALTSKQQERLRHQVYQRFYHAGAHFVIDSVADLPGIIDEIEQRLSNGEQP